MLALDELNDRPCLQAALAYAGLGWPVFPVAWPTGDGTCACRSGAQCEHPAKHPLVPGGRRAASVDQRRIADWWAHWPSAGIGMLTGAPSGLAVLDVDPRHGGDDTLALLATTKGLSLPATLTAHTGGGGRHHVLSIGGDQRVPNTSGRLPGLGPTPGLDIRGDGGYIVVTPSLHRSGNRYQWASPAHDPAPLPHWLTKPAPLPRSPVPAANAPNERYAAAVLTREADAVAAAPEGVRSDQLNRSAFALGTLAATGALSSQAIEDHLLAAALHAGLSHTEALRTIRSGLQAGLARPRT